MQRFLRLVLSGCVATLLQAADFTCGAQVGPAMPLKDFRDLTGRAIGSQFVLYGLWDLGLGQVLRGRSDLIVARGKPDAIPFGGQLLDPQGKARTTVTLGTLGMDYLYFLDGSRYQGLNVGAGLAYGSTTIRLPIPYPGQAPTLEHTAGSIAYALYGGYQISAHWGLELAFKATTFKKTFREGPGNATEVSYAMPVISLLAGFTF